jgi:hypothetical protein
MDHSQRRVFRRLGTGSFPDITVFAAYRPFLVSLEQIQALERSMTRLAVIAGMGVYRGVSVGGSGVSGVETEHNPVEGVYHSRFAA